MNLFSNLQKLNFWIGVIVVVIVWSWVRPMLPAVPGVTRSTANG